MTKIYIRTHAYNAEKTLRRAVDSVLSQTYTNFSYYLCENGSTDDGATQRIVEEYAKLDGRIVPFYNKINRVWDGNEVYMELPHLVNDDDCFCELDADDEYFPAFMEEMLAFMDEYNLDIACCGSEFLSVAEDDRLVGYRLPNGNLILEGHQFAGAFPEYHVFMRTGWAKLFKGKTLRNYVTRYDDDPNYPIAYGSDTYVNMRTFHDAKRVGILARPLHRYYISIQSVSHVIHPQRVRCDQILHEAAIEYLKQYGEISLRNWDFLFAVYMNALKDTLRVLLNAEISISEKVKELAEIFTCEYTKQLAAWENFGVYIGQAKEMQRLRKEFFEAVANWMLALEDVPDEQAKDFCDIGEFVCAAAENADGWIFFKKLRVSILIEQGRVDEAQLKLDELEELLLDDEAVLAFRHQLEMKGSKK